MGKFQLNKKGDDPIKIYEDIFKIAQGTVETHLGKFGKQPNPISRESRANEDMEDEVVVWWDSLTQWERDEISQSGSSPALAYADRTMQNQGHDPEYDYNINRVVQDSFFETKASEGYVVFDKNGVTHERHDESWEAESQADSIGGYVQKEETSGGDLGGIIYDARESKASEFGQTWSDELDDWVRYEFDPTDKYDLEYLKKEGRASGITDSDNAWQDFWDDWGVQDGMSIHTHLDGESKANEFGGFDPAGLNDEGEWYDNPSWEAGYTMSTDEIRQHNVNTLKDSFNAQKQGGYRFSYDDEIDSVRNITASRGGWDLPQSVMKTPEGEDALRSAKDEVISWIRDQQRAEKSTYPDPSWESKASEDYGLFGDMYEEEDQAAMADGLADLQSMDNVYCKVCGQDESDHRSEHPSSWGDMSHAGNPDMADQSNFGQITDHDFVLDENRLFESKATEWKSVEAIATDRFEADIENDQVIQKLPTDKRSFDVEADNFPQREYPSTRQWEKDLEEIRNDVGDKDWESVEAIANESGYCNKCGTYSSARSMKSHMERKHPEVPRREWKTLEYMGSAVSGDDRYVGDDIAQRYYGNTQELEKAMDWGRKDDGWSNPSDFS